MELLRKIAAGIVTLAILAIVGGVIAFLMVPDLFRDSNADIKGLQISADQRGLATGLESYNAGQPAPREPAAQMGEPPTAPSIEVPAEKTENPNPFFKK